MLLVLWCTSMVEVSLRDVSGRAVNNTLTIGFTFPWSGAWPAGPIIGGAFLVGIQEVKNRNLLPGFNINWEFRDTGCNVRTGRWY